MNCQQCEELIELYAADALDRAERDRVRLHLSVNGGCAGCMGKLTSARQIWSQLSLVPLADAAAGLVVPAGAKQLLDTLIDQDGADETADVGVGVGAGVARSEEGLMPAEREGLRAAESKSGAFAGLRGGEGSGAVNGSFAGAAEGGRSAVVRSEKMMLGTAGRMGGAGATGSGRSRLSWLLPAALAAVVVGGITFGLTWTKVQEAERKASGFESEVAAVRGAKDEAEAEVETLKANEEAVAEKLAVAEAKVTASEAKLSAAMENLNTLAGKFALTEKRVVEIEKELASTSAELVSLKGHTKESEAKLVELKAELASAQQTIEMLHSKQLLDIKLAGQAAAPNASARLLVDLENKVWKLYTTDLPAIDGRVYEFWLVTKEGVKVPMGSFTPDANGRCEIGAKVPDPLPVLVAAAITDEPAPGAKVPTGKMRVVGEIR